MGEGVDEAGDLAKTLNIILVDREHALVTVTRWVDGTEHVNEFIRLVLESMEELK